MTSTAMTIPIPPNVEAKIRPYNVVDLSTKAILSDEEIFKCLKQASEKQYLKLLGLYGLGDDEERAKPNGDAPNCMILPPKLCHSRSVPEKLNHKMSIGLNNNEYKRILFRSTGYDNMPKKRERANTAPSSCYFAVTTTPPIKKVVSREPSNQFDDHDDMARQRHLSDGSINATNDINNVNQISGTMTLGRDKKKKSKFKKFFKKLSTKKDGNNGKIEIDGTSDYFSSNDGLSRTSTSSSNNSSSANTKSRRRSDGSCSDPFQNPNDSFGSSLSNDKSKADWRVQNSEKFLGSSDYRHSTTSSDASSVSDFYSSSKRSDTSGENAPLRSSSSLRRTPLRRSIDDINNVFEIHKQTIDKVAYETSMLHCTCANIQSLDWGDFERDDDLIHLGISQYMITPVRCEKDKRNYTAWLRIKKQRVTPAVTQGIDYTKTTLHRHCLHVCHMIEQKYQTPNQVGIPTSIQVDNVYISPQVPRMTLGKYASVTVEKHTKYPEIYERETALVLLQIIKALEHYYRHDVIVTTVNTENVLVLKNNDSPITLSPRHEPNKCPMIALAALPGFENAHEDSEDEEPIANVCFQLAFVLLELLHSPYHEEVGDAADMAMLLSMLPDLTIKSTYSRHLQYVINFLLTSSCDRFKTFEEMKLILGVLLFGPTEISDHDEDEAVVLINKWHNRRCLDMVAHILKEAPLIMLCASGSNTHNIENLKSFDLEIILECEFLSEVLPSDIYRISKKLNR